ncbi:hypothetical protein B0H10DRAFT_1949388 [Mycena sp. CBHHK59/15]|nr:hypothetical protein B0H10DRAFT_1949388 [Mycena sp. CBHHK59/15]
MASFGPAVILAVLVATRSISERKSFEDSWKKASKAGSVQRDSVKIPPATAVGGKHRRICYVLIQGDKAAQKLESDQDLSSPSLGTKYSNLRPTIHPTFIERPPPQDVQEDQPEIAYLRPINIIHPVFYSDIGKCPSCGSEDITWDSWTTSGSREVHGCGEKKQH